MALLAAGFLASALAPAGAGAEGPAASLSSAPASTETGTRAQVLTDGPEGADAPDALSSTYLGFIYRDGEGGLPTRIRATGTLDGSSVNCGTADITVTGSPLEGGGFGFYRLLVISGDAREGCPMAGDPVAFRLMYGSVDDGVRALTANDTRFRPGGSVIVSLTPSTERFSMGSLWSGGESGATSASKRVVTISWLGTDGTAIEEALAQLDRPVQRAWRWDASTSRYLSYTPDGPSFVQTLRVVDRGDAIGVYFRASE